MMNSEMNDGIYITFSKSHEHFGFTIPPYNASMVC